MTSIVYLCRIDSEHGRKSERKHSGVTLGLNFFVIGNDSLLAHRQTALGPQLTSCNESLPVLGFSKVSVVNRAFSEEQDLTLADCAFSLVTDLLSLSGQTIFLPHALDRPTSEPG